MQKFLLPVAFVITSLSSCAQQSHLDKFYQKYHSTDGITFSAGTSSGGSINMSGDSGTNISIDPSFLLNANFSGNSGGTDNNWMRKVTNLRLLILNGEKNPGAEQQWTELEGSLRQDGFEELITVRHGKDRFRLLSKEGQGDIKQIALLIAGKEGGGLFFHFKGHFTEKDMDRMRSALQEHDSQ
ncbi:MAG TPA: DUF4252 domain-containing protein [Puia sp.]|jgi:hypothetical protein